MRKGYSLFVGLLMLVLPAIAYADTVTYYFDGYDQAQTWAGVPQSLVDGDITRKARSQLAGETQLLNSNTCPGTDLGTITKVELRSYGGAYTGECNDDIILRPVFSAGDGSDYQLDISCYPNPGMSWSAWADITNATNAPSPWTWADVQNLGCDVVHQQVGALEDVVASKVEIRLTYGQGPPPNQPPTASASASPTSGTVPLMVSFTGSGTDTDGTIVGYSWTFGDGGSSTLQNPTYTYNNAGVFTATLTVTDDEAATDTDSITISVTSPNQPPTVSASANPISGTAPLEVYFTASASDPDGSIVDYLWDFDDGYTSSVQNPIYIFDTPAIYNVSVTVTDDQGASATDTVTITVNSTAGQVPKLIRFQARLEDTLGNPLEGSFNFTFKIYDTDTGGLELWQELQQVVVTNGILDVELGSVTALNLPFDTQYWVGVEVESDGEMTPRFKLTTVPYSFKSVQ